MIKLIASDIDGTLLRNGNRKIPEEIFEHILRLKDMGILFAAASGRQYRSMRDLFAPVADEILYLCENGAIVYRDDAILAKIPMPRQEALDIIHQIQAVEDCEVLISGANTSYLMPKHEDYLDHIRYFVGNHVTLIERAEDIKEDILKVSAYCRSGAAGYDKPMGDSWRALGFQAAVAGLKWLDCALADKAAGMRALCRALEVSADEVMAFGDNFNDLSMLQVAGRPYIITGCPLDAAGYASSGIGFGADGCTKTFARTESVEAVLRGVGEKV